MMLENITEFEVLLKTTLRAKHQITLPNEVVKTLKLRAGDQLIVEIEQGRATLRPVKPSYRGVLRSYFDKNSDVAEFLRLDRESWDN